MLHYLPNNLGLHFDMHVIVWRGSLALLVEVAAKVCVAKCWVDYYDISFVIQPFFRPAHAGVLHIRSCSFHMHLAIWNIFTSSSLNEFDAALCILLFILFYLIIHWKFSKGETKRKMKTTWKGRITTLGERLAIA